MDTSDCTNRQRVQHIVDSYCLGGDDGELFAAQLTQLLGTYPQPLIELALTESIIQGWSEIPMPRGMKFIQRVHDRLHHWQPGLDALHQLRGVSHGIREAMSMDTEAGIQAIPAAATAADSVETLLTPSQFEQITGLDSSAVFDGAGKVRLV